MTHDSGAFVHLHVRSDFSFFESTCRIREIVDAAAQFDMPAVALTDRGNLHGTIEFHAAASARGIKPILGCELDLEPPPGSSDETDRVVLLCETTLGFRNLIALSTRAQLDRVDRTTLARHCQGLIALCGVRGSAIDRAFRRHDTAHARVLMAELRELFGHRNLACEILDPDRSGQRGAAGLIADAARAEGLSVVATNDVCTPPAEDHETHATLQGVATGKAACHNSRSHAPTTDRSFKGTAAMLHQFRAFPDAVANTRAIAERCHVDLALGRPRLPAYPCPEGRTSLEHLRSLCEAALSARCRTVDEAVTARLRQELAVIAETGCATLFLIVRDLVHRAHDLGIAVGPGRGSAPGSLVAYLLRITDIDPLKHGLVFERFHHARGDVLPQIVLDFGSDRRDDLVRALKETCGTDRVSATIQFSRERRRLPDVASTHPAGHVDLAHRGSGLCTGRFLHPVTLVVSDSPVCDIIPQCAHDGEIATQWDSADLGTLGFLKISILDLEALTIIQQTTRAIEQRTGAAPDLSSLPLEDPQTCALLARGETTAVFQLDQPLLREFVQQLAPERFSDVVAAVALLRPGSLRLGMPGTFTRRRHGVERPTSMHPLIDSILRETCGLVLYQEQAMRIAAQLAGFTLTEADELRRALTAGKDERVVHLKERFVAGAARNGVTSEDSTRVFEVLASLAPHLAQRSHFVAYGWITWQTAWLKAHHPTEFMAAAVAAAASNKERLTRYEEECRRMGVARPQCSDREVPE